MNLNRLHYSYRTIILETSQELKNYASLFFTDRGYCVDDLSLFFDDSGLIPGVRVALQPALNYDKQALKELKVALEDDLNNIVFDYAYNTQYKIYADDSRMISLRHIRESLPQFVIAAQN